MAESLLPELPVDWMNTKRVQKINISFRPDAQSKHPDLLGY
jgi:hypothetical protein